MAWNSQRAGGAGPPLPSLNALWTFDAVARHGSMTRAAAELCVTQTAVSHQIRRLEEELGYALFQRRGRRTEVTPEGAAWADTLGVLFARMRVVNQQLRSAKPTSLRPLTISIIPSLSTRWLVPRLGEYLRKNPEVQLRVAATERMVDLDLEQIDVAIRYGRGRYPGFNVTKLADDAFVPVCAPSLAKQFNFDEKGLHRIDLLHDDYPNAWELWFEHAGMEPRIKRKVEYTESSMLVDAVLFGQGVGLCRQSLVGDELRDGRLVQLHTSIRPMTCELAYYVLVSEVALDRDVVATFLKWLKRESRSLQRSGG
jgi:LysR family transcriptional regulator, glycine cleavage system transcriptional activator